ncbi:hypothetical protein [Acetivibrio clariflavus]|uniref:hypothetical protein n=1 Tax=Acetivibrio clariflavus TaxID=288965 RepID=UPI0002EF4396|nr:hypothetical protein [Acetivibrio clariflavus]
MYRVSEYNIYLKMKKEPDKNLIIQGIRGSFDVVDDSIVEILKKAEKDKEALNSLSKENIEILEKRGYITKSTFAGNN